MGSLLGRSAGARAFGLGCLAALLLSSLSACDSSVEEAAQAGSLAASALEAGDYRSAREAAQQAVASRDDVSQYWLILGQSQLQLQEFQSAFDAFQRAHELDRANPEPLRTLAELSVMMKRHDDAEDYMNQLLALNPQDPRALIAKGLLILDKGDHQGATRIADGIIKQDPRFVGALALKAKALDASGKRQQGAEILENALRVHGQSQPLLEGLLEIYQRSGDAAGEQRTYARLLAMMPQNSDLQLDYARMFYRRGERVPAFEAILRLHRANPDDPRISGRIANLWLELGTVPAGLREIRMLSESSPAAKVAMARYAAETRWPEEAVRLLEPLVPDEPTAGGAGTAALYAEALLKVGRAKEAASLAERVLALDSSSPRALAVRTQVALDGRRLNDALAAGFLLTSEYPRVPQYRALLARVHIARRELNLASQVLREASRDFPKSDAVLQAYVALLERQGSRADARALADTFTTRNRNLAGGWAVRSDLCRKEGDKTCVSESLARLSHINRLNEA